MSVYSASETGVSYLVKTFLAYEKPCYFLLLTAVCVILCAFFGKRKGRAAFFYPIILLLLTGLNPYVFPDLFMGAGELMTRYYRMLWLVPAAYIVVFAMMSVLSNVKRSLVKLIFAAAFLTAIVCMGAIPYASAAEAQELTGNTYSFGENKDLKDLTDAIEKNSSVDEPSVLFEDEDLRDEVREYSAALKPSIYSKGGEAAGEYAIARRGSAFSSALVSRKREQLGTFGEYILFH